MRRFLLLVSALCTAPGLLSAQTPYAECNQPLIVLSQQNINVCNAAVDGAEVFHPVAGLLVSGGNPVLGSVKSLGGLGRFSLSVRVNATRVRTPDLSYDGSTGTTVGKDENLLLPAPLVEAAVGIYGGSNGFLAVDLLGSAQLLPTDQVDNLSVDKDARHIGNIALGLGYGVRVGVFEGRAIVPSVTVTAMRRDIPRLTVGSVTGGDNYSYGVDLHATNLRAVAGYHLGMFSVGAGLGWDKYTGDARIAFEDQNLPGTTLRVNTDLDNSRTMAFLTAALDLPVFKLGAELGYQFGKDQNLKTTFQDNDPSDNRLFAGGGLRFEF